MIRLIALLILFAGMGYTEPVRIAAASSMQLPLKAVADAFEQEYPDCGIQVIIGSSGKLTAQILNGAPYDLFLSADPEYPQKLVQEGMAAGPVYDFAEGLLMLWSPGPGHIDHLALTNAGVRRIALANPRHAPYGRAAVETLEMLGLYEEVKHKLVYAENVAQVVHFVLSGAADAGFVAASTIPEGLGDDQMKFYSIAKPRITVQHAMLTLTPPEDHPCLASFLSFMKGDQSVKIFKEYGFTLSQSDTP